MKSGCCSTRIAGIFLFLSLIARAGAVVEVSPWIPGITPAEEMQPSSMYRVDVIQDTAVYSSAVYEIRPGPGDNIQTSRHNICSFSTFSFDGTVTVEVTKLAGDPINSCQIYPISYNMNAVIEEPNKVSFTLSRTSAMMAVIFNDDWDTHPLLVFGDPLEADPPDPMGPGVEVVGPGTHTVDFPAADVVYFAPGVHDCSQMQMYSGQTFYLPGDAYVKGWILETGLVGSALRGRGILSGETRPYEGDGVSSKTVSLDGDGTQNILVEGINFIQSSGFTLTLRGSLNTIRNIKITGCWRPTQDGINMGDDSFVEDCFIKACDDSIKIYNNRAVVRRCVIWQMENGGVFQHGWTGQNAVDNHVHDIDVIRTEWTTQERDPRAIIASVNMAGSGGGHLYENIRVDTGGGRIISMNETSSATWSNVTIRNLLVRQWNPVINQINGNGFYDIFFENLKINGQFVYGPEDIGFRILNGASNIFFTVGDQHTTPPQPDPAQFTLPPSALGQTEVTMTSVTGADPNGPVEYFFACTAGGGHDSGWKTDPNYTDTGLLPGTEYQYTVTMQDRFGNTTQPSAAASVFTFADPDIVKDHWINLPDLDAMMSRWLEGSCYTSGLCGQTDLNADGTVDLADMEILASLWLRQLEPDWTVLTYDDFESGWGSYTDGGGDCTLHTEGIYSYQGTGCADIQDNSGSASSFFHTDGLDLDTPGYTRLRIDFWFIAVSMETGEDFWVQYYDGSAWQTVKTYAADTDFVNDLFYHETIFIDEGTYVFPADAKIRFLCDASSDNDDIYIDQIEFAGKN